MLITIALDQFAPDEQYSSGHEQVATKQLAQTEKAIERLRKEIAAHRDDLEQIRTALEKIPPNLIEQTRIALRQLRIEAVQANRSSRVLVAAKRELEKQHAALNAEKDELVQLITSLNDQVAQFDGQTQHAAREALALANPDKPSDADQLESNQRAIRILLVTSQQEAARVHAAVNEQRSLVDRYVVDAAKAIALFRPLVSRWEASPHSDKFKREKLLAKQFAAQKKVDAITLCAKIIETRTIIQQKNEQMDVVHGAIADMNTKIETANVIAISNTGFVHEAKTNFKRLEDERAKTEQQYSDTERTINRIASEIAVMEIPIQELRAKVFLESQMYNAQNPQRAVMEAYAAFEFLRPLLMHWGINTTSSETERGISSHQTILAHRQIEVSPAVFSVYSQPITVDLKPALVMRKGQGFRLRMAIRAQRISRFFQEFNYNHSTRQSVHISKDGLRLLGSVDDDAILISLKYAKAHQGEKPIIIEADRADAERITKIAEANGITNYEVRIDESGLVRNVWRGSAFQAAQNEVAKSRRPATKREWHPNIVERMRQLATDYGYTNVKQNLIYKLCDRYDAVGAFINRKRSRYSYIKAASIAGSEPVIVVTRPAAPHAQPQLAEHPGTLKLELAA